jgi:hypothetical protein
MSNLIVRIIEYFLAFSSVQCILNRERQETDRPGRVALGMAATPLKWYRSACGRGESDFQIRLSRPGEIAVNNPVTGQSGVTVFNGASGNTGLKPEEAYTLLHPGRLEPWIE